MLEFATLFLGLHWGLHPVELIVGDPAIVKVELRLDGALKASLAGPPWKTEIELGELTPHRLEARGLSSAGATLALVEQWINVPRSQAEARLVVENDQAGRKTHARLTWESVSGDKPLEIVVRFDGVELTVADPSRFELPPSDLKSPHFLTAELVFPDTSTAHAEATFGGEFGDLVETELTAFPVRILERKAADAQLFECFSDAEGHKLRVAEVDREAADVIFVRDRGAEDLLQQLRGAVARMANASMRQGRAGGHAEYWRIQGALEKGDRVRFVWPILQPSQHPNFTHLAVFETSPVLTEKHGGLFHFLTRLYPAHDKGPQHLADAVALAGLRASAEGRRRAVVLVLGSSEPEDRSARGAEQVRVFLQELQVPLFVWMPSKKESAKGWPQPQAIGTPLLVGKAVTRLKDELDQQRIVWLAGRHLVAQIRFDAERCRGFAPLLQASPTRE